MQHIRVERRGRVTRIELARPEVLNAINAAMHDELEQAFNAFAADPEQWICVVTGAGRAFCAGTDLKSVVAEGRKPYPAHGYAGLIQRFDCDKPIIAAVNGLALGGGFELALACDIIIAVESAGFGLPEPLVGAVALGGGVHRLARQIGLKQAMGMILASRRVDAREGERLGFVTEVVPDGDLDAAVERWTAAILKGAPLSVRASKQAVMRGLDEPDLASALANQARYPAFGTWFNSADAAEGPRAFAEKRAPEWQGR
ncbi:enoyl-CoA hydratase [Novosphingobium sp. NBM11]|jgi:enoyl-CoA hydratase/carnithine racemase|uniref:enoyl-CoA hydratase-related protein n=1 Tax=unclassified Novosphingobium TaxID=2644732 RepID=UPI00061BAA49|nr:MULTISPECIES: enoyl-CoA hydratase-related protein [unclassified Novosphingobium]MBF5090693.1 enoyl-CoA hydratase [Novosphingobium sp. NBM11]GAO54687.1 enoyl-CoA hydratase [Novosphingobium sp. MD-1]